ncbi:MAG TPA: hypothetical protein VHV81_10740, partial [Steroidobacteraceae bacterium]|nr:hypothetical protein [Steroidobacteraceae bacterium]
MSSTHSASAPASAGKVLCRIGLALLGAAVVCGLLRPLATLVRYVPLDPNEGWNAFFAQIAMSGGNLYPGPVGSPVINNYPPVSFYVVGLVGRLVGDNVFAGRIVSVASMLIVAVNVYLWLRAGGSCRRVASLGSGAFLAFAVTYARAYAGIDDPQWLAHALMTTGVVVIWRGGARTLPIVLGAALMLAGGWTKHTLVSLPIATSWWLLRRSRPAFATWIASSAVLLAASAFLVWRLYGPAFFQSLLFSREYSWHQAFRDSGAAIKCFAPIVVLSLLLLPRARTNERNEFAAVYLVMTAVFAGILSGGIGVDINKYFDFMIAASLCAALEVEHLWSIPLPGPLRAVQAGPALTLLLGAYLGAYAASLMPGVARDLRGLDALERQTRADSRFVAETGRGRAACETPELCYWGKSPFLLD